MTGRLTLKKETSFFFSNFTGTTYFYCREERLKLCFNLFEIGVFIFSAFFMGMLFLPNISIISHKLKLSREVNL